MLVCALGGDGGEGLKKCTVCTLMKMLTFLDGPLMNNRICVHVYVYVYVCIIYQL